MFAVTPPSSDIYGLKVNFNWRNVGRYAELAAGATDNLPNVVKSIPIHRGVCAEIVLAIEAFIIYRRLPAR